MADNVITGQVDNANAATLASRRPHPQAPMAALRQIDLTQITGYHHPRILSKPVSTIFICTGVVFAPVMMT